jgi:hypothetical protein
MYKSNSDESGTPEICVENIKYNIEGNVDFYSEINNITNDNNNNNTCLITGEPLSQYYQTLNCGHSFNYIPLYLYVKQSKYKFNHLEYTPLKLNQIKCPYCRNIQNELLPYFEELDFPKVPGVNFINEDCIAMNGRCEFINYKKIQCLSTRVYMLNGKCYCYTHRNITIHREHNKNKKQVLIQIPHKAKCNLNDDVVVVPDISCNTNLNTTNNTESQELTQPLTESILNIQQNMVKKKSPTSSCVYIYVKGLQKGSCCNKPIYNIIDSYCKKHKK